MKLKQLKLMHSEMALNENEMKAVVGGSQTEGMSCADTCYVGKYVGTYAYGTPEANGTPTCYCAYTE